MQMNKHEQLKMRAKIVFIVFTVSSTIFCGISYASDQPQPGNRYKIVRPLYLTATYESQIGRAHV